MAKIIVIGAGAVGISTAYFLYKSGHEVTVVEKNNADNHTACSYGNAGMIVPSHFIPLAAPGIIRQGLKWLLNNKSPLYIRPRLNKELANWLWLFYRSSNKDHVKRSAPILRDLNIHSRDLFAKISREEKLDFGFAERGLMMYYNTSHGQKEEVAVAHIAQELGLPIEILDQDNIKKLEPDMPLQVLGGVHYKCDAHLTPYLYMQKMRNWLQEHGVQFLFETAVTNFQKKENNIHAIITSNGNIDGDHFIICGGSWSAELAHQLNIKLPLQAGKGYNFSIPDPPYQMYTPSILCEARIAITPMQNMLRIGGTMEIAGNNITIRLSRIKGILESLPKYLPAFNNSWIKDVPVWAGLRPCSPDGLPYIGRLNSISNLLIAAGHGMMGMSLAPVTGEIIADIINEKQPAIDISLLKPERFQ